MTTSGPVNITVSLGLPERKKKRRKSKRQRLHKVLASVVVEQLTDIEWTASNCVRYLTKDVLVRYRIRRGTPVTVADWNAALSLAMRELMRRADYPRNQPLVATLSSLERLYKKGVMTSRELAARRLEIVRRYLRTGHGLPPP